MIHHVDVCLKNIHASLCKSRGIINWNVLQFRMFGPIFILKIERALQSPDYIPKINRSSWARPKAKTGIRHRPPRCTILCTESVNRFSLTSLASCSWVPKVDSYFCLSSAISQKARTVMRISGLFGGISADIKCRSSSLEKSPVYKIFHHESHKIGRFTNFHACDFQFIHTSP